MANDAEEDVFATANNIVTDGNTDIAIKHGWRLETNSNGRLRRRWQRKHEDGKPMTYTTKSGGVGYTRGSKYVPKEESELIRRFAAA